MEEAAAVFTCFNDECCSSAGPAADAPVENFATADHRGIASGVPKDPAQHRRGRRLAVRTGNGNTCATRHQLAEHLGIGVLRNPLLVSSNTLRVGFRYRRA